MIIRKKLVLRGRGVSLTGRIERFLILSAVCSLILISPASSINTASIAATSGHTDHKKEGREKNSTNSESGSEAGSEADADSGSVGSEINNFGRVTDFYYRGAQPKGDSYNRLASIGIKTIIDLRNDPKDYAKDLAERAGLKYINFPMDDKAYPSSDAASKFLAIVKDQENWPVYVHCAGGRHRTGAMTAVFRMTVQGWDVDRAYDEMKKYDFYTRWGHGVMKQFVFDYYRNLMQKQGPDNSTATP